MVNEEKLKKICNFDNIFKDNKTGIYKYTRESIQKNDNNEFTLFWGHTKGEQLNNCCFSQWWQQSFVVNDIEFFCMEQFMMACKAVLFGDDEMFKNIMECSFPKTIKAYGRKVKDFDNSIWNKWKYVIVRNGNYYKFSQNEDLKKYLLTTKNSVIVEASPYDRIWGIGMCENNENAYNPTKWRGRNLLGFALMEVRDEIEKNLLELDKEF